MVPTSSSTSPGRPEATPSVEAAAPPSLAAGDGVPSPGLLSSGRVDPAVVGLTMLTARDGALQPRVTRPSGAGRCDCSLVVERRA